MVFFLLGAVMLGSSGLSFSLFAMSVGGGSDPKWGRVVYYSYRINDLFELWL